MEMQAWFGKVTRLIGLLLMLSVQQAFALVTRGFQPSQGSTVVFPGIEERMNILALSVVLLGGLVFLLNGLMQRADKRSKEINK